MSRFDGLCGALAAPLFFLVLSAGPARGASTLTLWTHPLGARLELAGPTTIRGETPLPLLAEQQGSYRVRVSLPGHETAFGTLSLRVQDGSLRLGEARGFRRERLLRSLAFPGFGQVREGRKFEGLFWGGATLGAGVTSLILEARYVDAHEKYVAKSATLAAVSSDPGGARASDAGAYRTLLHETFRSEALASRRLRDRNWALGAVAVLWGLNLADAAFFHSPFDVKEGSEGVIQVGLLEKTRGRKIMRSILYPGLGQSYAGQRGRGAWYAATATAAGVTTMVSHLAYKGHLDQIDALDRELAALTPGGQGEADFSRIVVEERAIASRRSRDDRDRRDKAAVVTAAIYAASLLDAALSRPAARPAGPSPRLGAVCPVSGDFFGVGVRVAF